MKRIIFFTTYESRRSLATEYARATGAYSSNKYTINGIFTTQCWLRSPGQYPYFASMVGTGGDVYTTGDSVKQTGIALRPAIIGYVELDGKIWFIVHDPLPVNTGETYFISYEKLVNGRNPQQGESSDNGIWIDCVVVGTMYSNNTIRYYFG